MSESGRSGAGRFVVDTNVFVAAIKPFSKSGHGRASTETSSLGLLLRLINDDELELFANKWLLDEYKRLGEELSSETSELIPGQLTAKMEATELERRPSHAAGHTCLTGKTQTSCTPQHASSLVRF
jgi:hypothetical protein